MRLLLLLMFWSLGTGFAQYQKFQHVSTAFGNRVQLYEAQDSEGRLIFAISNNLSAEVDQYAIETRATPPAGIPFRVCLIRVEHAAIAGYAKTTIPDTCVLPADAQTGAPLHHSSRVLSLRLVNGWSWYEPISARVASSQGRQR